jgi:SAM-dependent methyltransferase
MTLPASDAPTCLVCGAVSDARGGEIRCPACGSVFVRGEDGIYLGPGRVTGVEYPEDGAAFTAAVEDESYWFQHRNAVLEHLVGAHPPMGPLWDVGGGNGYQARRFQELGLETVLVEPGAVGCRNARERGVRNVVQATLESLALPEDRLHAVCLLDVIEHLDDPVRLVSECRRVLRPGGLAFFTVPAFGWLWSHEDVYAEHKRRYTRSGLRRDLGAAGLEVVEMGYFFQPLVAPILLLRTLPSLVKWRDAKTFVMKQGDHKLEGIGGRVVAALLARERRRIRMGRHPRHGSSLFAVARA